MMKETPWHYYTEGGQRLRIKAKYGIDYAYARRHNQVPDFTIIGTIEHKARNNRWYDHSGGQVTWEIATYLPEIAPYLKWHLVGPEGPMHYLANAKYFFGVAQGREENPATDPIKAFKRTIRFGSFPGDEAPIELREDLEREWQSPRQKWRGPKEWSPGTVDHGFFRGVGWAPVERWLEARLPKLQAAWVVDMGELGVLEENE